MAKYTPPETVNADADPTPTPDPLQRALAIALEAQPHISDTEAALVVRCMRLFEIINSHTYHRAGFIQALVRLSSADLRSVEELCNYLYSSLEFDKFIEQVIRATRQP